MIVLDTNVVSELMRHRPAPDVVAWVDAQPADETYLTAVTVAELLYGVARMPVCRRREALVALVGAMVDEDFEGRVLPFDVVAAGHYADVVASRERAGHPIGMADALIAAVCRSYGAALATRNGADFAGTDVVVVDPWA